MTDSETLMRCLAITARTAARDLTREITPEGLFGAEWAVLTLLNQSEPLSQAAVAAGLALEPPAISKALDRLEARGWIERKPGPDRREHRVALTPAARDRFPRWSERVAQHHARALAGLTESERAQLHAMLARVLRNLRPAG